MYTIFPMGFALLVIFMFVAFGLTTLFRRWIDVPTLLSVAIGCAVNANLFTPITHPIVLGDFTFSIAFSRTIDTEVIIAQISSNSIPIIAGTKL